MAGCRRWLLLDPGLSRGGITIPHHQLLSLLLPLIASRARVSFGRAGTDCHPLTCISHSQISLQKLANPGVVHSDLLQEPSAGFGFLHNDSGHEVKGSDALAVPFIGDRHSRSHCCLSSRIPPQLLSQKWVGIGEEP